jgi:hypothetical protein
MEKKIVIDINITIKIFTGGQYMDRLIIYYGWLNAFNSATNMNDNNLVALDFANYGLMVFGDGLQDPAHGDYANTQAIIPLIKTHNSAAKIFGYVDLAQPEVDFEAKVEQWDTLGVHGIFIDRAGYDFGTAVTNGRDAFNDKLAFVHSQDDAKVAFVNAWNAHHVLSKTDDPSYPNATFNPGNNNSLLKTDDLYLFESFMINTDAYTPSGIGLYSDIEARVNTFNAAVAAGVPVLPVASGIIDDTNTSGQSLFNILFSMADIFNMCGVGSSDTLYGASTATTKMWTAPPV